MKFLIDKGVNSPIQDGILSLEVILNWVLKGVSGRKIDESCQLVRKI